MYLEDLRVGLADLFQRFFIDGLELRCGSLLCLCDARLFGGGVADVCTGDCGVVLAEYRYLTDSHRAVYALAGILFHNAPPGLERVHINAQRSSCGKFSA